VTKLLKLYCTWLS